jgi:DNA-binding transcriptional LysR family regulator
MDIQQLKNFLHLSESLNFRITSESSFITQPALTRQIQMLEKDLGVILFLRTTKSVNLTPAGAYFKREIKQILTKLAFVETQTAQIHAGEAGTIRLAFSTSASQELMPKVLKNLRAKLPNLHTTIVDISNKKMVDAIKNQEIDVAFGPNINAPDGIAHEIVYRENFVLLMPQDCKIEVKKPADFVKLADENFILPSLKHSFGYVESILKICADFGKFHPKVRHESEFSTMVLRLVEAGLGISIEPKSSFLGQNLNIRTIELDFIPQKSNMTMLWLAERTGEFARFFECVS